MHKRSVLLKILIVIAIAMLLPALLGAGTAVCAPPYCQGACPANTYDCTSDWIWESWSNFETYMAMWYLGYSVLACCWA